VNLAIIPLAQKLKMNSPVPACIQINNKAVERSAASVCCRSLAGTAGSNSAVAWMSVCCECCVLSGRGLCDELIIRPEESY
jgi:hypothetical protein